MSGFPKSHSITRERQSISMVAVKCLIATICLLALTSVYAQSPDKPRRLALVIANWKYPPRALPYNRFGPLVAPEEDARQMSALLRRYGFELPPDRLVLNGTAQQVESAIRALAASLRGGEIVLIYYSGHGIDVDGLNYLLPANENFSTRADVKYNAVKINWMLAQLTEANRSGTTLLVLDSCRDHIPIDPLKGPGDEGFSAMHPVGALVASGTMPGMSAQGNTSGGASVFTDALINAISAMPRNPIEQVLKRARTTVASVTRRTQVPWVENGLLGGDFCFAREGCGDAAVTSASTDLRRSPPPDRKAYRPAISPLNVYRDRQEDDSEQLLLPEEWRASFTRELMGAEKVEAKTAFDREILHGIAIDLYMTRNAMHVGAVVTQSLEALGVEVSTRVAKVLESGPVIHYRDTHLTEAQAVQRVFADHYRFDLVRRDFGRTPISVWIK
ncbi:MAG: caspase family protein [Gammaproteobacteria bacterium]|nr:caspase family protein [Gammaproteobacteria bacterium]